MKVGGPPTPGHRRREEKGERREGGEGRDGGREEGKELEKGRGRGARWREAGGVTSDSREHSCDVSPEC